MLAGLPEIEAQGVFQRRGVWERAEKVAGSVAAHGALEWRQRDGSG